MKKNRIIILNILFLSTIVSCSSSKQNNSSLPITNFFLTATEFIAEPSPLSSILEIKSTSPNVLRYSIISDYIYLNASISDEEINDKKNATLRGVSSTRFNLEYYFESDTIEDGFTISFHCQRDSEDIYIIDSRKSKYLIYQDANNAYCNEFNNLFDSYMRSRH